MDNTAHIRGFLNAMFNPKDWTEKNFSIPELRELRQAIYNSKWERDRAKQLDLVNRYINASKKNNIELKPEQIKKFMSNSISYDNYSPMFALDGNGDVFMLPQGPAIKDIRFLNQIFGNPSYSTQMSIGSADYTIDKDGNVILTDTRNINNGTSLGNNPLQILHKVEEIFGRPYNHNINLGNINDWNMKYTGNSFLNIPPEEEARIQQNKQIDNLIRQNELNKLKTQGF